VSRILARSEGRCTEALRDAGCPCAGNAGSDLCAAAGSVDLEEPIEVAVIEDTHPLLQALRNELRPENAEIGGLLGMQALRPLVTDIDYPGGRVLFRCARGQAACTARPRVTTPGLERIVALAERGCFP
jgi:hypothetical protein